MNNDPVRIIIAVCLAAYGIYAATFAITAAAPPIVATLLVAWIVKAALAIVAAAAVWQRLAWDAVAVIALGAVIAAVWLFQGFVLGIVGYLYAIFAAVIAVAVALAIAAYLNGWLQFRIQAEPRSRTLS